MRGAKWTFFHSETSFVSEKFIIRIALITTKGQIYFRISLLSLNTNCSKMPKIYIINLSIQNPDSIGIILQKSPSYIASCESVDDHLT